MNKTIKKLLLFVAIAFLGCGHISSKTDILQRVAITGASVTSGHGVTTPPIRGDLGAYRINFKHIIEGMMLVPHDEVGFFGDLMFFRNSRTDAEEYIQQIIEFEPTLVIGIDYLFWFAYGSTPADQKPDSYKLERLNFALSLLDEIQAPLIIGDLPDVREAVGRMLSPNQVPDESLLQSLNARIYSWATHRGNVLVLPANEYWKRMMNDEEITIMGHTWPEGSQATLLQGDMLHTTLEGTVAAALFIEESLGTHGLETDPYVIINNAEAEARKN
jgi:hypothetical protein